jgi:hypothetical protein
MKVNAHSIPTTYAGVNFRSRLEAKWAAFFDAVGWRWEYEPFDRAGWIPDFVLMGPKASGEFKPTKVLVEIKPVDGIDDPLFKRTAAEIERNLKDDEEALILSYHLPAAEGFSGALAVGWLFDFCWDAVDRRRVGTWDAAPIAWWGFSVNPLTIGFCHGTGSFADRITGLYDGGCWPFSDEAGRLAKHAWKLATNAVQWSNAEFVDDPMPAIIDANLVAAARVRAYSLDRKHSNLRG